MGLCERADELQNPAQQQALDVRCNDINTPLLMTNQLRKLITSKTNILAFYQIFGGLFGVGLFVYLLSMSFQRQTMPHLLMTVLFLIAIGTFCYSIFCGIQIFRNEKSGLKHSWINQVVQIFSFSISGYGFQYVSGLYFSIGLDLTDSLLFKFNLGTSMWQLYFNQDFNQIKIEINILALLLIVFIDRQLKKIRDEDLEAHLSTIGNV
ncbi:MAG: hypothetical protein EOO46_18215 [Flavobacterium sp.]|nr:MAG: hypothetical protein EOO46_18215 [Flavobacterium sp.]